MANENAPPQENHETLKVSTSSDPHHSPKMLLIGLAAVLIIIIGAGIGYFLGVNNQPVPDQTPSPTPLPTKAPAKVGVDETANWKTYRNNDMGITLKYPSEFTIKITEYPNLEPQSKTVIIISNNKIDVRVEDNSQFGSDVPPLKEATTVIDGKTATRYVRTESIFTDVNYNNKNYSFSLTAANANATAKFRPLTIDEVALYDQILSTFQFTDQIMPTEKTSAPCPPDIDKNIPC